MQVYDLGCGDGRMLTTAAAQRGCRGVGVELNAELAAMAAANVRQRGLSHLVTIRQGDATQADVRDATVLMLYLSEKGNVRILKGVEPSLQPGTRVVSYFWTIPDAAWEKRLTAVDTTDKLPIYLYRYDCGGGGAMRTAAETATASSSSAGSSFGGADTLPAVQESVVAAVRAAADKQETPRPNHLLFPLAGT